MADISNSLNKIAMRAKRGFTTGRYSGKKTADAQICDGSGVLLAVLGKGDGTNTVLLDIYDIPTGGTPADANWIGFVSVGATDPMGGWSGGKVEFLNGLYIDYTSVGEGYYTVIYSLD